MGNSKPRLIQTGELWPNGPATYKVIRSSNKGYYMTMFVWFVLFILVLIFFIRVLAKLLSRTEGFEVSPSIHTLPSVHNNDMKKLHDTCTELSHKSCQHASFCTLLNGTQCVGGNRHGPTYSTDNGKKVGVTYYHHKDKCYGKCN